MDTKASEREIVEEAEGYVLGLLGEKLDSRMVYHSPSHTCEVVGACELIGEKSGVAEDDMEMVLLAAWFHDTGYVVQYEDHEENGKKIAREFLEGKNYPTDKLEKVLCCIDATKMEVEPRNDLERIICDADLYHVSTSDCIEKADNLRAEWEVFRDERYSDRDWYSNTIKFYEAHRYHTDYGKDHLNKGKQINISNLKELHDSLPTV